jgi:hypothetical protein
MWGSVSCGRLNTLLKVRVESVRIAARIRPYRTGRLFWDGSRRHFVQRQCERGRPVARGRRAPPGSDGASPYPLECRPTGYDRSVPTGRAGRHSQQHLARAKRIDTPPAPKHPYVHTLTLIPLLARRRLPITAWAMTARRVLLNRSRWSPEWAAPTRFQ